MYREPRAYFSAVELLRLVVKVLPSEASNSARYGVVTGFVSGVPLKLLVYCFKEKCYEVVCVEECRECNGHEPVEGLLSQQVSGPNFDEYRQPLAQQVGNDGLEVKVLDDSCIHRWVSIQHVKIKVPEHRSAA